LNKQNKSKFGILGNGGSLHPIISPQASQGLVKSKFGNVETPKTQFMLDFSIG
jgi:hypothetical protein